MKYTIKLALALNLLLPLTACDLDQLPSSDRAALTTDDDARPDHRRPGPPPPLVLLRLAVDLGELQDDPDMAEALATMEAAHTDAIAARDALRLALADAVAAETVTADAVAGGLAMIGQAATAEGDALTVALDTAHALLDAELRAEVVESLPEPPPRPEAGEAPSGDRPSSPPPEGEQQPPPPPGAGPDGGPMGLLEALDLDETQQQALRDTLGEPERPEPPAPLDLEAFAEDDFEAASLGLADLHATHVTEQATRHVELLVALVPLLDDEQRATLEDLLRDAPPEPTRSARG
jgi:hypothetical protein